MADNTSRVGILISYDEVNESAVDNAESRMDSLSTRVNDTQQGFRNLADGVMMFAQQFDSMANSAIQGFASFDQSMANVNSIVSGTDEEIEALRGHAEAMGREFPVSAQEAADGLYQLASAGKSANDIMAISDDIMKLSVATATDFATASGLVTAAQDIWKYSNEELNVVNDTLMNGVKSFKQTLPELAGSLQYVGKAAETVGVDLQTTVGIIGMVRQEGIEASAAGTGLRMMFQQLAASVNATEGALAVVGDQVVQNADGTLNLAATLQNLQMNVMSNLDPLEQAAFLSEAFGARASNVSSILINQADSIQGVSERMGDLGSTTEAFEVQADGAQNKLLELQARYEEQERVLGEQLLPAETKLLEMKIKLYSAVNKLPGPLGEYAGGLMMAASEMSSFIMPMSLVISGLQALNLANIKATASTIAKTVVEKAAAVATGIMTAAQWALNAAMYANPYVLIVVAVIALIAALVGLAFLVDELTDGAVKWYEVLLLVMGPVGWLIYAIIHWNEVSQALVDVWYALGDALIWIGETAMAGLMWYIDLLIWEYTMLWEGIKWIWDKLVEFADWIIGFGPRMYEAGKDFIQNFIDGILDKINGVQDKLTGAVKKISGFFGGSPPEFGPLYEAMERGGPAFVNRWLGNLAGAIPAGGSVTNYTGSTWIGDFSPVIQNYGTGGGGQSEANILEGFEEALELLRRDALR